MLLEVKEEALEELRSRPGAELIDFARRGVRPWSIFDLVAGWDFLSEERVTARVQFDLQNITDRRFV